MFPSFCLAVGVLTVRLKHGALPRVHGVVSALKKKERVAEETSLHPPALSVCNGVDCKLSALPTSFLVQKKRSRCCGRRKGARGQRKGEAGTTDRLEGGRSEWGGQSVSQSCLSVIPPSSLPAFQSS
eukprot:1632485-Rhodomonas_salina.6